jgi:hypothetical protein
LICLSGVVVRQFTTKAGGGMECTPRRPTELGSRFVHLPGLVVLELGLGADSEALFAALQCALPKSYPGTAAVLVDEHDAG